jgi:hypothetical protein
MELPPSLCCMPPPGSISEIDAQAALATCDFGRDNYPGEIGEFASRIPIRRFMRLFDPRVCRA